MAKQIIVLEQTGNNRYTVAFWLSVPVARQPFYANAAAKSAYKDASAGEITTIQTGSVVEQTGDFSYVTGTGMPAIQAALQAEFASRQAVLTAANPWVRYGSSWDGASWTAGSVA